MSIKLHLDDDDDDDGVTRRRLAAHNSTGSTQRDLKSTSTTHLFRVDDNRGNVGYPCREIEQIL